MAKSDARSTKTVTGKFKTVSRSAKDGTFVSSGLSGKSSKSLAGSVLSQSPVTKRGKLSAQDASQAVRGYLSERKK